MTFAPNDTVFRAPPPRGRTHAQVLADIAAALALRLARAAGTGSTVRLPLTQHEARVLAHHLNQTMKDSKP